MGEVGWYRRSAKRATSRRAAGIGGKRRSEGRGLARLESRSGGIGDRRSARHRGARPASAGRGEVRGGGPRGLSRGRVVSAIGGARDIEARGRARLVSGKKKRVASGCASIAHRDAAVLGRRQGGAAGDRSRGFLAAVPEARVSGSAGGPGRSAEAGVRGP